MTAAELIKKLQKLPADANIAVCDNEYGYPAMVRNVTKLSQKEIGYLIGFCGNDNVYSY